MHITHLALGPDVIVSCLLDWTDNSVYVGGDSRDKRLIVLWSSYRNFCEVQKIQERAQRRLFTTVFLKPDSGKYLDVSQKTLNATGCRYMLFWVSSIARQFAEKFGTDLDMHLSVHKYRVANLELLVLGSILKTIPKVKTS